MPGGGTLEQADGTAWMALYCQWMLQIAVELREERRRSSSISRSSSSPTSPGSRWRSTRPGPNPGLWDEEDGFYYDVLRLPDGETFPLKVRSLVGPPPDVRGDRVRRRGIKRHPELLERATKMAERFSDILPSLGALTSPSPRACGCSRSSTSSGCAASSR